jgi:hypothetical protein
MRMTEEREASSMLTISGALGFELNDPIGGFSNYSSVNPITDDN